MDAHEAPTKVARLSRPTDGTSTEVLSANDLLEISSLPPQDLLAEGAQLGAYVIERRIGDGGGGVVYAARHGVSRKRVAVKVLRGDMLRFPTMLARFKWEATAVSQIRHPNIVEVYEVGEVSEGRPYFAMELLEGMDLRAFLKTQGRCAPAEALELLDPVCRAVQAAHEAGFIHRDIKASNVIITDKDGRREVKLLDFGIAKLIYGDAAGQGLTEPGMMLGTAHSMAPEQVRCERLDQRADVYAIGVLLFQLLTGQYPFQATDPRQIALMHLQTPAPRPSMLAPVSPAVDAVVLRCLEKSRDERFASASELLDALRAAVGTSPAGELAQEAPAPAFGAYFEVDASRGEFADDVIEDIGNMLDGIENELSRLGFSFPLRTAHALLAVRPMTPEQARAGEEQLMAATITRLCAKIEQRANKRPEVHLAVSATIGEAVWRDSARGGVELVGGSLLEIDTWTQQHRLDA